ncbi:hypothetical protein DRF65_23935 [Chryseobacterium pennae]|uniref:Immunity protein 43 domain-containing protein n=1 Tax=Chryseobacterium pennae TaxID=2258962 RepID=A0A3D9C1P4_9FLAO|nr:hypothetical protein [Chryseobacterium pennae]REC59785.1 hypothetical protein DRF65_23935 [Chryseobacterium pennae]
MTDLFIWFNRTQGPEGHFQLDDVIFTSSFDSKKPKFVAEQPWKMYDASIHGFPPEDKKRFPSKMYLVSTKNKPSIIKFDFYGMNNLAVLVSSKFLTFLNNKGIDENYYEIAELSIIDLKGNDLTNNEIYYALRFVRFDDQFFDFNMETKKRAAGLKNFFLFPDMKLNTYPENKNIFYINSLCYRNSIIFTKDVVKEVLSNFHLPQVYNVKDFPFVFNNQYKWDILPLNNEYLVTV